MLMYHISSARIAKILPVSDVEQLECLLVGCWEGNHLEKQLLVPYTAEHAFISCTIQQSCCWVFT